jgi:hypothetical protein
MIAGMASIRTLTLPLAIAIDDGITDIDADFPAKDLFNRKYGKQIVLGEKTFDPYKQNVWWTSNTTVKWKATFTRTR